MALKGRQFNNLQELMDYLNGVISSEDLSPTLDLDTKTLLINDGADKTVTFVGTALTPNQIVAQINAVTAGAAALRNYGQAAPSRSRLVFILATLTIKVTGTANALLGLPTSGSALVVGASAVAKTDVVQVYEWAGRHTIIHE